MRAGCQRLRCALPWPHGVLSARAPARAHCLPASDKASMCWLGLGLGHLSYGAGSLPCWVRWHLHCCACHSLPVCCLLLLHYYVDQQTIAGCSTLAFDWPQLMQVPIVVWWASECNGYCNCSCMCRLYHCTQGSHQVATHGLRLGYVGTPHAQGTCHW